MLFNKSKKKITERFIIFHRNTTSPNNTFLKTYYLPHFHSLHVFFLLIFYFAISPFKYPSPGEGGPVLWYTDRSLHQQLTYLKPSQPAGQYFFRIIIFNHLPRFENYTFPPFAKYHYFAFHAPFLPKFYPILHAFTIFSIFLPPLPEGEDVSTRLRSLQGVLPCGGLQLPLHGFHLAPLLLYLLPQGAKVLADLYEDGLVLTRIVAHHVPAQLNHCQLLLHNNYA